MKRFLLLTISIFALAPAAAQAATCTSNVSGSFGYWEEATTWTSCDDSTPGSDDTATIASDDVILIDGESGNQTATSLTINSGLLQVSDAILTAPTTLAGGALTLFSGGTLSGSASADTEDSSIFMGSDTYIFGSVTLTNQAELSGYGNISQNLVNTSGVVHPGDNGVDSPPGTIRLGTASPGSYTQGPDGILEISIRPDGADRLNVEPGMATIAGALEIGTYSGAVTTGQTYSAITTTAGLTGTFDTPISGLAPFTAEYTANNLNLVGPAPVVIPPVDPPFTPGVPLKPTITLPSNKKCKKSLTVKITPPAGTKITSSTVKAGKKKIKTKTSSKGVVSAKIKLKKKTKISITAKTSAGGTLKASKTYKRCS